MDTKFRSSFIPKVSFEKEDKGAQSFGLLGALAVLIFIVSLLVTGSSFLYRMMLKSEIDNLKSQVSSALSAIDKESANEIILFDKQLNLVEEVLSKHVTVSNFFEMLEKESVSQVQFTDLNYSAFPGGNIFVNMNGKAKSYAAIALQEDTFLKNLNTVSVNFNGMKIDSKSGTISFSFKGEFKSDLVKFSQPEETASGLDLGNEDNLDNLDLNNLNL